MEQNYDFIVVGSGSAGGALATRLSENGKYHVACLEAGSKGAHYLWTFAPATVGMMIENPLVNWCRKTKPDARLNGREIDQPGGKILGGSSSINGMIYNRGQSGDYDNWAKLGCKGWSYKDVLPFFKKIESTTFGSDKYRGRSGPLKISVAEKNSTFYDIFIGAANSVGIPTNEDYSAETQFGVAMAQQTVYRGIRQSTARQYLYAAAKRQNLSVIREAEVVKLLFDGNRCIGVRLNKNGEFYDLYARKEVILSSGAAGSPKILELSGVGNREILEKFNIKVLKHLPGVGENLRDHFGAPLKWSFNRSGISLGPRGQGFRLIWEFLKFAMTRRGVVSQGWCTMRAFVRSNECDGESDIALLACPFLIKNVGKARVMAADESFFLWAQIQRPESSGSSHIKSSNPFENPEIQLNVLDSEKDRRIVISAIKKAREVAAAEPLAGVIRAEIEPGPAVNTDEEILNYVKASGTTTWHPVGTCKMGVDEMSVVDERLRVYGIKGLRVADASIMPMIISGNTNIPCIMIGEKCADMIIEDWEGVASATS